MKATIAPQMSLTEALADELRRAAAIIRAVPDPIYKKENPVTGSVGRQFRHVLDVAACLIAGVGAGGGRVDYSNRRRDLRTETDGEFAAAAFESIARQLPALGGPLFARPVSVRSDISPNEWLQSTLSREVEFVFSHTLHHHALIAERLRAEGCETGETSFGVAPSTIRHWLATTQ